MATGRISQYAADGSADDDGVALPPGQDHTSLAALLRDLRLRAEGGPGVEAAGSSRRRPLHIVLDVRLYTCKGMSVETQLSGFTI